MYLKIHPTPKGDIVALCDCEHIGTVIFDGKRRLDLAAHAAFYQGKKVARLAAVKALRGAENINIVGKKSLSAAKQAGVEISSAVSIGGVPHLQLYRL